jgi:hypothetical protein
MASEPVLFPGCEQLPGGDDLSPQAPPWLVAFVTVTAAVRDLVGMALPFAFALLAVKFF